MEKKLQLWGGIECTVNRIGDKYFDQCERNGHNERGSDLDAIAALGIRTLRYPVIWEKIAPNGLRTADWSLTDRRLDRLQELGIEPIAGLCHHGSGPRDTSLVSEDFAPRLAEFAHAVAERYPWLRMFTPVNEPLTTGRFSALYGVWYPHLKSDESFVRSVLVQCKAITSAMSAIRDVIPQAQLIQTEDMGKTHSTPPLAYQASFENERRWLTLDLLCGRMLSAKIHRYLIASGATEGQLSWFRENAVPPDVLGINHYITSERFLDHRMERYPVCYHGGNNRHSYADIEAVRVCDEIDNIHGILREVWDRYELPISITEAHIGDTPEEQQRWLWERWVAALDCRQEGIDVRAVTVWALFGSYDWNSLLVKQANFYEPGVFDVRNNPPSATPLAEMVKSLCEVGTYRGVNVHTPGWWKRPDRIIYPVVSLRAFEASKEQQKSAS